MNLLVTGASGFVGRALYNKAVESGISVRGAVRRVEQLPANANAVCVPSLSDHTDWTVALQGCSEVIHCAARVHLMNKSTVHTLQEYRVVNVQGTLNLAHQAAASGVQRFVFLSSIKVNGDTTQIGQPFTPEDAPAPRDAYGISKMEAEQGLLEIAARSGMEVAIIRSPLVYGFGVKANFAVLMEWVLRGVPLPLGAIHNQRSFVALDNLIDLVMICLTHPAAANKIFLVSDGEDVSTTELLRRLANAMSRPVRLVPVPASWLRLIAGLVGRRDVAMRLCGSLQLDISKTREVLGWTPPLTLNAALKKMVQETHG